MLDQPVQQMGVSLGTRFKYRRRYQLVWRMAAVSALVLVASASAYPFLPRIYTANADILLRPTNQEGATTWDQSVRDALDDNAIQTKIDILRSEPLQVAVITKHDLLLDPEFNAALHPSWFRREADMIPWLKPWLPAKQSDKVDVEHKLAKNLIVKRERKSYLIQVGYESRDPDKAAALSNTLAIGFLADQIGRKRESHELLLTALGERVTSLEARYQIEEEAEHRFVAGSGLEHRGEHDSMVKQLESLSSSVAEAHRRTVEATGHALMLASQRGTGLDSTIDALASPLLQRLRERWVELSAGAGSLTGPTGASSIVLNVLRQAIEAETQHLVKATQNDASVAQQTEAALRSEIGRIDLRLTQWQENERHRLDIHRAVTTTLDALAGANQRYMQEAGRGDVLQPDVEIVSLAATPDRPTFPNPLIYGGGTIGVMVLICGLVLMPTMREAVARAR